MSASILSRSDQRIETEIVVRVGAAAALLGSAVVHSSVIAEHNGAWPLAGVFFLSLQTVETMLALAVIFYWSFTTAAAVVVTSVGTVAVWLVSRTAGMPFGPAEFRSPEAVGTPDLACFVLELAAAALVIPWALRRLPARRSSWRAWSKGAIGMAGALTAIFVVVTVVGLLPSRSGSGDSGHTQSDSQDAHSSSPGH
jgi:hypothetical protein